MNISRLIGLQHLAATAQEAATLTAKQEGLGRPEAVYAALFPIRKSPQWWAMAQDERRKIHEKRSRLQLLALRICHKSQGDCTIARISVNRSTF